MSEAYSGEKVKVTEKGLPYLPDFKPGDVVTGVTLYFKDGDSLGHTVVFMERMQTFLHDLSLSYNVSWLPKSERYRLRIRECSYDEFQKIKKEYLRPILRNKGAQ